MGSWVTGAFEGLAGAPIAVIKTTGGAIQGVIDTDSEEEKLVEERRQAKI